MKINIQKAVLLHMIFVGIGLIASDKKASDAAIVRPALRRHPAYFMDDRSPQERALLEKIRQKIEAEASPSMLHSIDEQGEQGHDWGDEDCEVSVFVTEVRGGCQSPLFSPRSDSTETLENGQNRSGARNPSPLDLTLQDLEIEEKNAKK